MTKELKIPKNKVLPYAESKVPLFKFQVIPTQELLDYLCSDRKTAVCLQGGTGSGKTFCIGEAIAEAQRRGFLLQNPDRPFQHYSGLYICPKNCIIKVQRELRKLGVTNIDVTSYDSFRTDYGELFVTWETVIRNGIEDIVPNWDPDFAPDFIICDESQFVKSFASQRGKVIREYIRARLGKIVFISATHFQKPCEAEYAIHGCGLISHSKDLTEYLWSVSPQGPTANSPIAIERIRKDLESRNSWIKITGVRYPFKPKIDCRRLPLVGKKREIYDAAEKEYHRKRYEAGKPEITNPLLLKLNAMREFKHTSELLMSDEVAVIAKHIRDTHNNSIIYGTDFIDSLKAVKHFLLKIGVPRNEISELHGGVPSDKKQMMIDVFQEGKTRYFLTTLKSGGTGLSLHHELESSFPRTMLMRLPWSIYEFIQFLGRGQRITNLSPVQQYILTYKDTIEDDVADRLDDKLKCVNQLLDRKDNFIANIFNKAVDKDIEEAIEKEAMRDEDGESEEIENFDKSMLDGEN